MRVLNFFSDPSLWNDREAWSRFDGCFSAPGLSGDEIRDLVVKTYTLDRESKVDVDSGVMVELIQRGHARAQTDFQGLLPDNLVYFLCPMSPSNEFALTRMNGLGGFAARNAVLIYANPVGSWQNLFYRIVLHETNHVARYPFGNPYASFREWVILEGMAERYVAEVQTGEPQSPWVDTAEFNDLTRLFPDIRGFWDGFEAPRGTVRDWFFGSDELGVPLWLGYALGFQLVSRGRELMRDSSWSEFIRVPSTEFAALPDQRILA